MHSIVPKECLPNEYGGSAGPISKLQGNFVVLKLRRKIIIGYNVYIIL